MTTAHDWDSVMTKRSTMAIALLQLQLCYDQSTRTATVELYYGYNSTYSSTMATGVQQL